MAFQFRFTDLAMASLQQLRNNPASAKRHKAVQKALGKLQINPKHPGLNTHKYSGLVGPHGADAFEAYAENNTPRAYRIFWSYGPKKNMITILAITAHP